MQVFEANITRVTIAFLRTSLEKMTSHETANRLMLDTFGLLQFFEDEDELVNLKAAVSDMNDHVQESDRSEYGDFQTNSNLTDKVTSYLYSKNVSPEVLIEPTCGKGNFLISALKNFNTLKKVMGIEIYKPYVWETKFSIINFFLKNPAVAKPEISILHRNVFDIDFKSLAAQFAEENILIIGNPPWVTNSKLGSLNSSNLPAKSNFKNFSGLDALTGKSNFDIAEYIAVKMIETFQSVKGRIVLLVKNSVIRNIVFDQRKNKFKIGSIEKFDIDSKKEFNVSVEAALFCCELNSDIAFQCSEFNFYENEKPYQKFGWSGNNFVSNIKTYTEVKYLDGICPFVWRQGLKHDCSSVMELDRSNGHFINGLNEQITLEEDLVYGILKSSDLKNTVIDRTRKFTIVTQRKVGQETKHIKTEYPKTYQYLSDHQANFDARKSSIYQNKPLFSIFGIGDYSFKPYKVAISGLYKTFHFSLILPQNNKPLMLDDTCYLIGFDKIEFAGYALLLLNSHQTKRFLQSITFSDAKRVFTKEVLMRIDMLSLSRNIGKEELEKALKEMNDEYDLHLTLSLWSEFIVEMTPVANKQISLFD